MTSKDQTAKKLPAPRLRFPGFDGEWEEKKLGDVLTKNSRRNKGLKYSLVQSVSNSYGFINQDEYFSGRNIASKDISNYYVIDKGCFAYNPSRIDVGSLAYKHDDTPSVISPLYVSFKANSDLLEDLFLLEFLFSEGFKKQMVFEGGVRNTLSFENLSAINIPLPPTLPEQTRIAAALSSLDAVIAAHQSKQDALREHKRGLMAGLFPAEGERVPRLRFPEFEGAGEWEEKKLGELGTLVSGLTYRPDDVRTEGLLVLRSSNIQNGKISLEDCVYVRPDIKGANLSKKGDILICVRNGSTSLIGKNALIPDDLPLATHGAFMTVFRSDFPEFCHSLFQTDRYSRLVANDLGATINSINGSNLIKYKFYVPSLPEQTRIAAALSSLDDLITAQGDKIAALQTFKRGLMQGLFPTAASADASATQEAADD